MRPSSLSVIDSHTAGEPTRTVVGGLEDLDGLGAFETLKRLREKDDWVRRSLILEPRGSDVMVGAVLSAPRDSACAASVVFFNNVDYLGMCGHGLIGVVTTLAHQKKIDVGIHRIETPVGIVLAELLPDGNVSFENVASYRYRTDCEIEVPDFGTIKGDVAWGGNWFFLSENVPLAISWENRNALTRYASAVRTSAEQQEITGADGALIDHFEFFQPSAEQGIDADNFVLCPGAAFDRSPCGTGTSAKLACLAASGKLAEGARWRQRSVTGGVFEGSYRLDGNQIIPRVSGRAYVNGMTDILFDPKDPLAYGLA